MSQSPALLKTSLASICEHGGHWCRRCQRYVIAEESDQGQPKRCPECHNVRLRFDPPIPGYHYQIGKDVRG